MASGNLFKRLKLIDEAELTRLIEKQLREYDPALKAMANLKRDMDSTFAREDLLPEEMLSLLKASHQRFRELKPGAQLEAKPIAAISNAESPRATEQSTEPQAHLGPGENVNESFADAVEEAPSASSPPPIVASTTSTSSSSQEAATEGPFTKLRPNERRFYPAVPEKHSDRLTRLVSLIRRSPSHINHDSATGQLILEGALVKGSSFRDLIHSLFESSVADNITGQNELLKTIGKLVSPGGEWEKEKLSLRDIVPRTSLHPYLISGPQGPLGQKGEGAKDGKRKNGASNPTPPGKRIKILYLY